MTTPTEKPKIKGIEPKHITYVKARDGSNHDALVVKELIHLEDGRRVPNLRLIEDYKRPFWITQKGRQNHKDKKDYEYVKNLQKYTSTQIEMPRAIANLLKDFSSGPNPPLRRLARSPYLYGTDVSSTTILKADYRKRSPGLITPNRVAGGDIETNVHSREGEIICMSVTHKEHAAIYYLKSWVKEIPDVEGQTRAMADKHIGKILKERNVNLEVYVVDRPADIVIGCMNRLHEWKPDFLTFWNIDFDVTHMIETLSLANIDPADVFSDPSIPTNYRYFDYRKGQSQKVTASGKVMPIDIQDRWNWCTHPATFQMIDSMPVYRNLRLAKGKDSSYALDYILKKELGMTKLKFDECQHLSGLRWHEVMQEKYKIEYGVYNIFDSMSLELLDEKTNDLALSITLFSKNSDYKTFNSNPKKLCDDMYFWYQEREEPCIIGSSSDEMVDELDSLVVGHDDWIITLASYMAGPMGMECIEDIPGYKTMMVSNVFDLDLVSTYPTASQILNIARETCVMEFSKIQGISEEYRREVGVNLTGGRTNAVEICEKIMGAPTLDELAALFRESLGKKSESAGHGLEAMKSLQ